ncbi:hypothetical protein PV371_08205 [Streptomyces sp. TX20-6-3]|uniref:hypothetical protein n=1 Tax=Streptomyces sp. TX20-6-3 TaxID=3028705 RepID=UPI0029B36CD6|nr:hypothetical protein [Streptomyces sp. TX20-6-3]MDX2559629.1 hypothetical protein [Streptomyces sp. TX20-6-3]
MISEPELDGDTSYVTTEVLTEEQAPRPPRPRRPWLWALGGAVVASAVWGGGLYAVQRGDEPGPDLGGYQQGVELCEVAELKALAGILGKRSEDGLGPEMDEPAVFETSCSMTFGPPESGYSVSLSYSLHKVSDPGPEFAPRAKYQDLTTPISGLGEQAFFDARGGEGGELRVLDGQVELALSVYRQYDTDAEGNEIGNTNPVDLSGIDVPMTQDMLALMAALKKTGSPA